MTKDYSFDAIPTNTTYARDLIRELWRVGIVGKCSFCFSIDWEDGPLHKVGTGMMVTREL